MKRISGLIIVAVLLGLLALNVVRWRELEAQHQGYRCWEPTTSMEIIFFGDMPCVLFVTDGEKSYDCNWKAFSGDYPADRDEKTRL